MNYTLPTDRAPKDFEELLSELYHGSYVGSEKTFRTGKHYANIVYRGHRKSSFRLHNGLTRPGAEYVHGTSTVERNLLRNFKRYAAAYVRDIDSEWEWLALAQHYRLPTRLLDWTFSPLVALHFATEDAYNDSEPAAVWCVDYTRMHRTQLPTDVSKVIDKERARTFTLEMLDEMAEHGLQDLPPSKKAYVLFFEAPAVDARLLHQYSVFTLSNNPALALDEYLTGAENDHEPWGYRVLLNPALKLEVREKLDIGNINEKVLFPGLEGIAQWLRRNYLPRPDDRQRKD